MLARAGARETRRDFPYFIAKAPNLISGEFYDHRTTIVPLWVKEWILEAFLFNLGAF